MKKSLRLISCLLACIFFMTLFCFAADEDIYSLEDFEELREPIFCYQMLEAWQEYYHDIAEDLRERGVDDTHPVIQEAKTQWSICEGLKQNDYEEIGILLNCYEEYPVATYVYYYLTHNLEYSHEIASGIVGNMMVEVGGQTLDLQHQLYSYGTRYFYGLCQWNRGYYSEIHGKGLLDQCNYLADTIEYEIDTYGFVYQQGYKYDNFLQLDSSRDAALMFAKSYERCAASTYGLRQRCAEKAYEYFIEVRNSRTSFFYPSSCSGRTRLAHPKTQIKITFSKFRYKNVDFL